MLRALPQIMFVLSLDPLLCGCSGFDQCPVLPDLSTSCCPGQDGPSPSDSRVGEHPGSDLPSSDAVVIPGELWTTIPPGSFFMGSPGATQPIDEEKDYCSGHTTEVRHEVVLTHGFEIATTEVTQEQFTTLMNYNPSYAKECGADCPVENMSWSEAASYCNALSAAASLAFCYDCTGSKDTISCLVHADYLIEGKKIYDCPGYRLPTDAEWEYAYRAGTKTAYYLGKNNAATCSGCTAGDTLANSIGWYCYNAEGQIHPVKKRSPNAWGLYDMAGNVKEWTDDYGKEDLGPDKVTDPWISEQGAYRIVRGGSYDSEAPQLRAAYRGWAVGASSYDNSEIGFRCVRSK